MERLTYKNYIEEYEVNFEKNSEKQWSIAESDTHIKVTGEPIDKLAEFEDFMERNDLQELEQLQEIIERDKFNHLITAPFNEENQALKDRWQKLKEWVENNSKITSEFFALIYGFVLDKMEELEKEIK